MGLKTMLSALLALQRSATAIREGTASELGGDSYAFALSGALDRASVPRIRKVMFEEALSHREIRIDLSGLELIDSAGLATLVEAFAAAKRGGREMAFHSPSDSVRRALRFTRLDQVFPIFDSGDVSGSGQARALLVEPELLEELPGARQAGVGIHVPEA
jgi:anti-sigma B factor antagonist